MSHHYEARINYSNACKVILEDVKERAQKILVLCEETEKNSSEVIDAEIENSIKDLKQQCKLLLKKVDEYDELVQRSADVKTYGKITSCLSSSNNLYLQIDAINRSIIGALNHSTMKVNSLLPQIDKLEESKLKSMMKLLARNEQNSSLSFDELKELAESKIDPSKKVSEKFRKAAEAQIKEVLGIEERSESDPTIQNESFSPLELMNESVQNIIDESLRQSAVKSIIKSITDKGFIVDRKNIRKKGDVVTIIAVKPGNQKAEFSIDLSGKFSYRFDGYEGKACEKDISAMEEDLENIYGINITEKKTIWENPDKLTKRQMMYHKTGHA